jgi:predicted RecB family nuclease
VQFRDGHLVFSPSDLSAFVACPHLTSLQVAVARGDIKRPFRVNPHADLIRRKGEEHEARYLDVLRAAGRDVREITLEHGWDAAARATEDALRDGAEIVYQAVLAEPGWRGLADFVERRPDGSYEVVDTKLARHARPAHVLQLCFYTEQVARITGRAPRAMHVVTGLGERETFRPGDYDAYYRRLRSRFLAAVRDGAETYPYPVEHCSLCAFLATCKGQWQADDHLTQVAGVMRTQVERLLAHGIATLEALGDAPADTRVQKLRAPTFANLRQQAGLQLHRRRTGEHRVEHLPAEEGKGFAALPEPSPGDVWLDLEGDPWYEPGRGLEYLFGWVFLEDGEARYDCIWGRSREDERAGFERLMDLIAEQRRAYPGMHVYHYAPYERTALRRLMGEHGTRERELDDLLRNEVLVDLYRVTRQALRASVPSYSIKEVEALYGFERRAEVGGGGGAAVAFEAWLESNEPSVLDEIRDYNEEDCRSLYELHRWLVRERPPDLPWLVPPSEREVKEEAKERQEDLARLRERLLQGAEEGEPPWLLAHLLEYHRREERPAWWEYFHHLSLDEEELIEDGDTIGGLALLGEPVPSKQSLVYTLAFPPQEHKLGGDCVDPATEKGYHVKVDNEHGTLTFRRSKKRVDEPLPRALIPPRPIGDYEQRDALKRVAEDYLAGSPRWPALREVLERQPPRAQLDGSPIDAALSLDRTHLFVQGPPGSGKTHNGAHMAVALMRRGQRVGVMSTSHKAINNFLTEVEKAAAKIRYTFKGRKKSTDEESRFGGRCIDSSDDNADMLDEELRLIAGTAWLFSRAELDGRVDTLFVDEGGQVSLADALAVGTSAPNLVILGDPNQLAQVSQGSHPPGASASVLAHLLGGDETVRPRMGLFLERTWRLRPEVCDFISATFYEGRLEPADAARQRSLGAGNGIVFLPVVHEGHVQASPEEARAIEEEVRRLLGTVYRDEDGERPLEAADIVVVAPYNAHVRSLREHIRDERIRIGTVDKFQGQEAPVVFYSMASSSGEDVLRGLDFLFSRNRLNVAISRAKCRAYLVASPRLLDASCRSVEQMRLANALCRLVETASR